MKPIVMFWPREIEAINYTSQGDMEQSAGHIILDLRSEN